MTLKKVKSGCLAAATALLCSIIQATAADILECPDTLSNFNAEKSLVVHKPSIIAKGDFSFARTIGRLLTSLAVLDTPANRQAMVKTMLTSLSATEWTNDDSQLRMRMDPRATEALIDPAGMLDVHTGMKPVALINRLDLAPEDWNNCGEYRIVYEAHGTGLTALIFEASLRNPHPEIGGEGCRPVAEFWRSLSGKTDRKVAEALEHFFYDGLSAEFGPAISAENFGMPLGQVRSNSDVGAPWQLREWKVSPLGGSQPAFLTATVKYNPLAELYADNSAGALDPAKQEQVRSAFQQAFVAQYIGELLKPDLTLPAIDPNDPAAVKNYRIELLNTFGAHVINDFNEFQSTEDLSDVPVSKMNGIRSLIAAKIGTLGMSADRLIGDTEVANRAAAVSCAGCHHSSYGQRIGRVGSVDITWPPSTGELHILQDGTLSDALEHTFLPFRQKKFLKYLCTPPAALQTKYVEASAEETEFRNLTKTILNNKDKISKELTDRYLQLLEVLQDREINKNGYFVTNRRPH